ncbi:hypothetical protein [Sulfuricurvum sp.]|uniref:hypothetical protein n=1 Tax=Sulfuricurvum sp. TaxID=2025608 RepID=UPI00262281F1|nr:hypothetical protein [Sulfuricurvum sp.]MDD2267644.1 hypothetical protein [Sulfuricurvum sp.]MDD2784770.1 hypothetical protein [Sulfuricurvum sp.]
MILNLSTGKSIPAAYKDYYVAMLISSRKWRRDLIHHWTNHGGSPLTTINGKVYWGGTYDMFHLNESPDKIKMADYLGIDDTGKDELSNISGADWSRAYFRPTPKTTNPYSAENVSYMLHNGLAALCISKGLSSVVFKSANIEVPVVYVNGVADDPMNHVPAPIDMKGGTRTSSSFVGLDIYNTTHNYSSNILLQTLNALGTSNVGNILGAIYNCTNFFEQFCSHTISVSLVDTIKNQITNLDQTWVFQTWDSFAMGDYSWMDVNNITDYLYPQIVIGSSLESDYFTFSTFQNIKNRSNPTEIIKNLSGYIMDIVDGSITGNTLFSSIIKPIPYSWAIVDNNHLWFEYEYIMAMDIKEFAHLLTLHLDIEVGADSGFWGTFIGSFIGVVLNIVSTVIGAFFKVVELCDFIMKPTIRALLKVFGVNGVKLDKIIAAYTEIRNQIALIVATIGIGAYLEGSSIAAESSAAMVESGGSALSAAETDMIINGSIEAAFGSIGSSQLAEYGLKIASGVFSAISGVGSTTGSDAVKNVAESSSQSTNPMQLVYGDNDIDIIDALYMMMDDPMMALSMDSDTLSMVYS